MRKVLPALVLVLLPIASFAIKPEKAYIYTPEDYKLEAERISIGTSDGATLSTWRIPASEKHKADVVVACSDAGNMSYWLTLAYYLHYMGYDVWMFDYRGFGESSGFEIKREMLFYEEFVTDLEAVLKKVESSSRRPVYLVGYSMGTTVINEYLNSHMDRRVKAVVHDGFVADPQSFAERLRKQGKQIELPQGYSYPGAYTGVPALYINALQDKNCSMEEIPSVNSRTVDFDCGHIMALSSFTDDYMSEIVDFFEHGLKK